MARIAAPTSAPRGRSDRTGGPAGSAQAHGTRAAHRDGGRQPPRPARKPPVPARRRPQLLLVTVLWLRVILPVEGAANAETRNGVFVQLPPNRDSAGARRRGLRAARLDLGSLLVQLRDGPAAHGPACDRHRD